MRILFSSLLLSALVVARFGLAEEKPLVALNPTPITRIEISHPGDVHHLSLPPSINRYQSITMKQPSILGESLKNAINPLQMPPDYRFKPQLAPYRVSEMFVIPTPIKFASF